MLCRFDPATGGEALGPLGIYPSLRGPLMPIPALGIEGSRECYPIRQKRLRPGEAKEVFPSLRVPYIVKQNSIGVMRNLIRD